MIRLFIFSESSTLRRIRTKHRYSPVRTRGRLWNFKSPNSTFVSAKIVESMTLPAFSTLVPSPFSGLGDKAFAKLVDYLASLGLAHVPVTNLKESAGKAGSTLTRRITGSVVSSAAANALFHMEIIKQVEFAVGFTVDRAAFGTLTEKLFKKKIGLFGSMRDAKVRSQF